MCDKKIKLLFDGSLMSYYEPDNGSRSGIFFATYNLLKEFMKHDEFDVTLYCNHQRMYYMQKLWEQDEHIHSCKLMNMFQTAAPLDVVLAWATCKFSKNNGKKDNIFKKVIRFIAYRYFNTIRALKIRNGKFASEAKKFDVFFTPHERIPVEILDNPNIKRFTILHDAIPLVLFDLYGEDFFATEWLRKLLKEMNFNDYYFTDSACTRKDFLEYAPQIDPEKTTVAYLGASDNFYQETDIEKINAVRKKYNIPEDKKYIFSLCTLEPRKNLVFAAKNFLRFIQKNNIDDFVFVLGGGHWHKFLPMLEKEIADLGDLKEKILKIGYVDDVDLAPLYNGAKMFVYPSLYEGFGLPVLEAMQCGCPVITSNVSSIPEVIGDAGIQIDPKNDEELIQAYEKMYFDEEFAKDCALKGLERAKLFSWEKCANLMCDTMKKACGHE